MPCEPHGCGCGSDGPVTPAQQMCSNADERNLQAGVTRTCQPHPTYNGNPLEGGDTLGNGIQMVHKGAGAILHAVHRSDDGCHGGHKVLAEAGTAGQGRGRR